MTNVASQSSSAAPPPHSDPHPRHRAPQQAQHMPHPSPTRHQTYIVFLLFVVTDVLLSVDSGALPVALPQITTHFHLSRFGQGTVGALSPAGFALATTSVGVLLTRRSPRSLLVLGLATTALSSFAFAAAPSSAVLLLSRAGYGVAYAVFFVFAPVWISMFAPDNRATSWISVIQAGAPIGAVVGFVIGGVVAGHDRSWRITFFAQAAVIAACTAAFAVVPSRFVDGDQSAVAGSGAAGAASAPQRKGAAATAAEQVPQGAGREERDIRREVMKSPLRYRNGKGYGPVGSGPFLEPSLADAGGDGDLGSADVDFEGKTGKREGDLEGGDHVAVPVVSSASAARDPPSSLFCEDVAARSTDQADGLLPVDGGPLTPLSGGLFGAAEPGGSPSRKPKPSPREQLAQLLANKVFVYCSLALAFLTFTVEGIRYWVVLYRTEVFHDDISEVVASFTLVSATAPILGMFFGGWVIDRAGGYRSKEGVARSLRILMFFSLCAGPSAAAVLLNDLGSNSSLRFFAAAIWLLLFFGGAHVAPLTGIMIAVVAPEMRSLSSAVSLLVNHVIGYFLAPFGIGILANMRGIKLGFQTVISTSAIAISFCLFAWAMSEKEVSRSRQRKPRSHAIDDPEGGVALLAGDTAEA